MKDLEILPVIRTNLLRRGDETPNNPTRTITQYWDMNGNLLWEVDPINEPDIFANSLMREYKEKTD